jgi:predicted Zn-dependent peptidase
VERAAKRLGAVRRRPKPTCSPVTARTRLHRLRVIKKSVEQTHLAMGLRLFGRNDPRRFALKILSVILGENMSSRLFQVVRERHGLAYSVSSSVHLFRETGTCVISAGLDRKRTPRALELMIREMNRLGDVPVGPRELKRAKDYTVGQLTIGLESTTSQMMWIGENILAYGSFMAPAEVMRRLQRVTAEDVQRVARAVLRKTNVSMALVSPDDPVELGAAAERALGALR